MEKEDTSMKGQDVREVGSFYNRHDTGGLEYAFFCFLFTFV